MNKKNYLIPLFLIIFIIILIGYFVSYFFKVQNSQLQINSSTILKPRFEAGFYHYPVSITYPFLSNSPDSNLYILTTIKEKFELFTDKYDNLFLALKRLAEIQKWGNDLPITSWERVLENFQNSINQYTLTASKLENKVKTEKLILAKNYLAVFQVELEAIIRNSNKNDEEKIRLNNFQNNIFTALNKKIGSAVPPYDPMNPRYIINNLEPGHYDLTISTASLPNYLLVNNRVKLDKQTIKQNKTELEPNTLSFSNIIIDNKQNDLFLQLNNVYIPIKDRNWIEQYDEVQKTYRYSLPIPLIKEKINYLLNFQYDIVSPTILLLGKNIFDNKQNIEALFVEPLFVNKKKVLNRVVSFDTNNKSYYYFILISQNRMSEQNLSKIDANFQPIIDPEITLKKTSTIGLKSNSVSNESQIIILIRKIIKILFFGIILFILFHFRKYEKFILSKFKIVFLLLTIFFLFVNIFIISWPTNKLYLPSLFFWIMTMIGYKFEERISLIIALVFLIFCPLFISGQDTVMAEKLATYSYLFLLTGGIHSLISYIMKKNKDEKNN